MTSLRLKERLKRQGNENDDPGSGSFLWGFPTVRQRVVWGASSFQSASLVSGRERNVRIMAPVPDKANTLHRQPDCVFQNKFEGFYVLLLQKNVCVRLGRGGNEVSHESQHLTNKPRVDTLNSPPTKKKQKTPTWKPNKIKSLSRGLLCWLVPGCLNRPVDQLTTQTKGEGKLKRRWLQTKEHQNKVKTIKLAIRPFASRHFSHTRTHIARRPRRLLSRSSSSFYWIQLRSFALSISESVVSSLWTP